MLVHAGVKERARMKESADAMYGMTPSPHYYIQLLRQYSVHHSLFCTFVFVAISSFRIPIVSNRIETTFVAKQDFCLLKTIQ